MNTITIMDLRSLLTRAFWCTNDEAIRRLPEGQRTVELHVQSPEVVGLRIAERIQKDPSSMPMC